MILNIDCICHSGKSRSARHRYISTDPSIHVDMDYVNKILKNNLT